MPDQAEKVGMKIKSQARSQTIQIVPLTEALKLRLLLVGELIRLGRHIGFGFWKCSEIKIIFQSILVWFQGISFGK